MRVIAIYSYNCQIPELNGHMKWPSGVSESTGTSATVYNDKRLHQVYMCTPVAWIKSPMDPCMMCSVVHHSR